MKLVSLKSKLALAAALTTIGLVGTSQLALAQPDAAPATKPKVKRAPRKAKGGLPAKTQAKLEAALGKPLTAEQKTQLDAAANERRTAVNAAQSKFDNEAARITGLTLEKVRGTKPKKPKATMPKA